jgi:MFS family permease
LILLPTLFRDAAVVIIIVCIVWYHAAGSLVAPQWSSLMGDLVPERRRGRYFALRTRYTSVATFVALVSAGLVLNFFQHYDLALYGFIGVFGIAAVARWVSVYHLTAMVEPQAHPPALEMPFQEHWWRQIKNSRFVRFSIFFGAMQWAVAIGSPFFAVYMLRDLHFSYMEFMAISASSVLMQFLTLNGWGRVGDVFGNRLILVVTGFVIPMIPLLWLFSNNLWYLLVVQSLSGLLWAGFSLSSGNYLYDLIPPRQRVRFLSFHNVFTNIGTFFGALLGGYLGAVLPNTLSAGEYTFSWDTALLGVFLISAVARLTVALLFLPRLKEVREVRPMTATQLIFRATRFNALSGMVYDIIAAGRRMKSGKPGKSALTEDIPVK